MEINCETVHFMHMSQAVQDDWNQHWADFSAASEMGPATKYRQEICLSLLDIAGYGEGVRLLDIGSGTGKFAEIFCSRFTLAKYRGLELSQTGVELAAKRFPDAEFLQRDLMAPTPTEEVPPDATHAVCSEVLEHLDDPVTFLRNVKPYLAPDCRLVVTVPGGKPNAFDRYIGHRRHYNAPELRGLLQEAGFDVELSTGIGFPFFNIYRLLTTLRGERLRRDVSGSPSLLVRAGTNVFGVLFRFNLMSSGWQTVAVARYRGACAPKTL